jgi:hypothetical protein
MAAWSLVAILPADCGLVVAVVGVVDSLEGGEAGGLVVEGGVLPGVARAWELSGSDNLAGVELSVRVVCLSVAREWFATEAWGCIITKAKQKTEITTSGGPSKKRGELFMRPEPYSTYCAKLSPCPQF